MKIYQAYALATEAHRGQVDPDGQAHIYHCVAVAEMVRPENKVAAFLHDVKEDCEERFWTRVVVAVSEDERAALVLLTHKRSTVYADYIDTICAYVGVPGDIARDVKRADLMHNLSRCLRDVSGGRATDKTFELIKRYKKALVKVLGA